MIYKVAVPIEGFEDEKEFIFEKVDEFFSIITAKKSQRELRLMSFGALKSMSFKFPDEFISKMSIEDIKDISIYYIFVLQENPNDNSLNTFAPIVFNNKKLTIGQVRLDLQKLGLDKMGGFFNTM